MGPRSQPPSNPQQRVSNQVGAPASGALLILDGEVVDRVNVSNQVGAPASGADTYSALPQMGRSVSNQVGAPASGASSLHLSRLMRERSCFQSSGCPSEWGPLVPPAGDRHPPSFQSSGCPSEWGRLGLEMLRIAGDCGFQSSGCPSEWGHAKIIPVRKTAPYVSNQVGAPASGAGVCWGSEF